jgi:hypothetical protein
MAAEEQYCWRAGLNQFRFAFDWRLRLNLCPPREEAEQYLRLENCYRKFRCLFWLSPKPMVAAQRCLWGANCGAKFPTQRSRKRLKKCLRSTAEAALRWQ